MSLHTSNSKPAKYNNVFSLYYFDYYSFKVRASMQHFVFTVIPEGRDGVFPLKPP